MFSSDAFSGSIQCAVVFKNGKYGEQVSCDKIGRTLHKNDVLNDKLEITTYFMHKNDKRFSELIEKTF